MVARLGELVAAAHGRLSQRTAAIAAAFSPCVVGGRHGMGRRASERALACRWVPLFELTVEPI
jgi:hypothetical protein